MITAVNKRIAWIDIARGLAMIAIVFGHTVGMGAWRIWVYSFHVPLFFVLSGMTFHIKESFQMFCLNKAKRLLVPYYCFGLISIFVFVVGGNFAADVLGRTDIDTSLVINIFGLLYGNGKNGMMDFNLPLWFLPCLFVVYLLSFCVMKLESLVRYKTVVRICILALTVGTSFAVSQLDSVIALPFSAENAVAVSPFFYLGVLIGRIRLNESNRFAMITAGAASLAIGAVIAMINARNGIVDYVDTAFRSYPLFFSAAVLQSFGLIMILSQIRSSMFLERVGRNTMPILVMHKFPVVLLQVLLTNISLFGVAVLDNPLVALLLSIVVILMCLTVNQLISRWIPWIFGMK